MHESTVSLLQANNGPISSDGCRLRNHRPKIDAKRKLQMRSGQQSDDGMASQTVEHHLSIDGSKIEHKSERREEKRTMMAAKRENPRLSS